MMSDPGDVQEVDAVSDLSLMIQNLYHLHFCHMDCELILEYTICTGCCVGKGDFENAFDL